MFSNWMGDGNKDGNIATFRVYGLLEVLGLLPSSEGFVWERWWMLSGELRAARLSERMHATCKVQNKGFLLREGKGSGQYIQDIILSCK